MGPEEGREAVLVGFLYLHEIIKLSAMGGYVYFNYYIWHKSEIVPQIQVSLEKVF